MSELRSAENAFNKLRVQRDKAWVEEAKCLLSMGERNAAVTRLTRALDYISADERELWEEARTLLWAEVGFSPEDNVDKPSAQPLTGAERDALRVALQRCWNVGSLSSDALRTTIVVAFSLSEIGRPKTDSIRMVNFAGGSETAAKEAFERARRAIIRCGTNGFDLPIEKYDQWRNIEMTFIHERMAIR